MPIVPTDMEKFQASEAKAKAQRREERRAAEESRKAVEKLARAAAKAAGMDPEGTTIFICNRGRK